MLACHEHQPKAGSTLTRTWLPRRVLITPAALEWEHGRRILDRAESLGSEIVRLKSNRITGISDSTDPRRLTLTRKRPLQLSYLR